MICPRGINLPYWVSQVRHESTFVSKSVAHFHDCVGRLVLRDGRLPRPLCYGRMMRLAIRAYATAFAKDDWMDSMGLARINQQWFGTFDTFLLDDSFEFEKQRDSGFYPKRCQRLETKLKVLLDQAALPSMNRAKRTSIRRLGCELFGLDAVQKVDAELQLAHALFRRYLSCWPNHHMSDGGVMDGEF